MKSTLPCTAKEYWTKAPVNDYYLKKETSQLKRLSEIVMDLDPLPSSIFEFGCGTGRNLATLKPLLNDCIAFGIDINPEIIKEGKELFPGLDLHVTDEAFFSAVPDPSIPCSFTHLVFTISVFDHIENLDTTNYKIFESFCARSYRYIILIEPFCGKEGLVYPELTDTPFTYSWNYDKLLARLPYRFKSIRKESIRTDGESPKKGLNDYYNIWVCKKFDKEE